MLEAENAFEAELRAEIIAEIMAEAETETLAETKAIPFLGFTDTETVKLDVDNRSFKATKYWALRALERFPVLIGFLILKSSDMHYHVVFDARVSWRENLCVVGWVAICSRNKELLTWLAMQCVKGTSTLRVAPKGYEPAPRIVFRCGEQDHQVKVFLKYRKLIKKIYRETNFYLVKKP